MENTTRQTVNEWESEKKTNSFDKRKEHVAFSLERILFESTQFNELWRLDGGVDLILSAFEQ